MASRWPALALVAAGALIMTMALAARAAGVLPVLLAGSYVQPCRTYVALNQVVYVLMNYTVDPETASWTGVVRQFLTSDCSGTPTSMTTTTGTYEIGVTPLDDEVENPLTGPGVSAVAALTINVTAVNFITPYALALQVFKGNCPGHDSADINTPIDVFPLGCATLGIPSACTHGTGPQVGVSARH